MMFVFILLLVVGGDGGVVFICLFVWLVGCFIGLLRGVMHSSCCYCCCCYCCCCYCCGGGESGGILKNIFFFRSL